MTIEHLLIPVKFVVDNSNTIEHTIKEFFNRGLTEAPVVNGKKFLGVLSLNDLYRFAEQNNNEIKKPISEVPITEKLIINLKDSISKIEKYDFNRAIVINDDSGLIGIIRKQDLIVLKLHEMYNNKIKDLKKIEDIKASFLMSDIGREVMDFMKDGVYVTDSKGVTIYVNNSYTVLSGLNKDDLIGKAMNDLINLGYFEDSASLKVLETRKPITIIDKYSNGNTCLATSSPVFDSYGNITFVVTNVRDVTELIHLKERLEKTSKENKKYKEQIEILRKEGVDANKIIGNSKQIREILEMISYIADVDTTILIQGETGVGKEVFAKEIHSLSDRRDKPFIKINCSAIPDSLFESQLFGYEKGAFTGAINSGKEGLFETANGGSLLLDEIGEIPLNIQPKLLRVLQEKQIMRVGSSKSVDIDVRIIVATNKNLWDEVQAGRFREDLYYRLNIIPIKIPPLRERVEDIKYLSYFFLERYNLKYNKNKNLSLDAIHLLESMEFKGNVRQLKNLIERIVLVCPNENIEYGDIITHISSNEFIESGITSNFDTIMEVDLKSALTKLEEDLINDALSRHKTTRKAAKALGISQPSIVRKAQKYNIKL